MSYEEISIDGFISEIRDVSNGPHPRKFCFVLGAGASRTSGIKTGQELVNIWDKELFDRNKIDYARWKKDLKITEDNKFSYYSQYYEKRFKRCPADGYNYLEKLMENAKPSSGYVMLSYLLSKTNHNVVITTNFDHLIEDAINYYIQSIPLVIGHETLAHYITKQLKRPTILKIHRDLLFDPANRVSEVELLHDNWKRALDVVFSEYHPIFIGYAGNDNSLMNYLIENSKRFLNGDLNFPYWMLYKNDKLDSKVLSFLDQSDGYCIKHNGFDEVLYLMGAAFEYKMPSMDDFLSDAKKRFHKLSDAIDGFTDKLSKEKEISPNANSSNENTAEESKINLAVQQITNQTDLQRMYRNVILLYNSGKYNDALPEVLELIDLKPKNARYHNIYSSILHAMKRYDEALAESQKAIDLEPGNALYHDSLSTTLHVMERYDEALSEAQKAVDLEPENAQYHDNLSATLHAMNRYDEALAESQKAVALEPENAQYHDSLAATLNIIGRYDEALVEKKKAVDLEPENAQYHDSLSATLHEMENYDEALIESQKAVDLEPENAQYHDSLAATLNRMGRYDEALVEKKKAVALEPENAQYHDSLSATLHEMEYYDEALIESEKAVDLEPENAQYHDNLSTTLHAMKRFDEALIESQKAVDLEPENARYHDSLGATLKAMGRYDEAQAEAQRAIKLEEVQRE